MVSFAMPAIFDSLVRRQGLTPHVAWRVAFIVPFILITATATGMLLTCQDTPTGKWSERHQHIQQNLETGQRNGSIVAIPAIGMVASSDSHTAKDTVLSGEKKDVSRPSSEVDEAAHGGDAVVESYTHEIVQAPTGKEILAVICSLQTLTMAGCYFCSFGAELAINSILGSYYLKNFPALGQTHSGQWAAMFGLVNVVFRPMGGFVSDLLYKYTKGNLWAKKFWIHFVGIMTGVFCLAIGLTNPHNLPTMIGLVVGLAAFMDAGNGANFGLVPHVHPHANGRLIVTLLLTAHRYR